MPVEERVRQLGERFVHAIERQEWLDKPSYSFEHGFGLVLNLFGGGTQRVRNLLHGQWLGHPLHPLLTDIPLGAWTATSALDLGSRLWPRRQFDDGAQLTTGVGLAGAVATAITGVADWQFTHDYARRVGVMHATLNTAALSLYLASWLQRRRGEHDSGRVWGALGYGVVLTGAYLGGTLVYRHRTGVDHSNRDMLPAEFVPVLAADELEEGQSRRVSPQGMDILLVRTNGSIHGLSDSCAHLGAPMSQGWIHQGAIVCPWHGSRYKLDTGDVVRGPATAPLSRFETRVRDGQIEVRRAPEVPESYPGRMVRSSGE
jgi:nitrite reductase/ring-hydroxylating ferredoxin subunit/uncharacterized membrane protein